MRYRFLVLAAIVLTACAGDDDETSTASGSGTGSTASTGMDEGTATAPTDDGSGTGLVMNECGTFDPGEGIIPQDPNDQEIVSACTAFCLALNAVPDCSTDAATCLESCRLSACDVCPGTLAPLVGCQTENLDTEACTCEADGAQCPPPDACTDLEDQTTQCGG